MMEFPGRIYLRAEDIQSAEHQAVVNSWIEEYERNRRTFIFPEKAVRTFGYIFLVLGLFSFIFQITLSAVQHAYIPSLLGSGMWIGVLSMATGVVGLYASQKRSSTHLLDFMVMTTIVNIFSALVVVLNTIGLEMYSKLCFTGRSRDWIGDCAESTVILQSILVFLNILLFIISACCSGFVCRTLETSFQIRAPPLVVYYSHLPVVAETEEQKASRLSAAENKKTASQTDFS